jgi:hypothetical protein
MITALTSDPDTGIPAVTECLADGCRETQDLVVQECAPGRTWMFTGGVCGHWAFIYRAQDGDPHGDH